EHRISAAFLRTFEGPVNDNIAPIGHSIADTQIGSQSGITVGAHISEFVVRGPMKATGVSDNPARKKLFVCYPKTKVEEKPRADALGTRFAAQWLRLPDIEKVHPDALQYPDFHEQLADDMREETQQFFMHLVRDNRSAMDLFGADYTYLNESLANHYGIPGVT